MKHLHFACPVDDERPGSLAPDDIRKIKQYARNTGIPVGRYISRLVREHIENSLPRKHNTNGGTD